MSLLIILSEVVMSLMNREGVIWLDGEFVSWQEARVHSLTHTLHYGVGVFEGVRAYETDRGPVIFRLHDHTERLFRSAKIVNMTIPYNREELNEIQQDVIRRNQLHSAYIRPMVFYGAEYLGLQTDQLSVHTMIAAWEWGAYLGAENLINGIRICTSSYTRNHVNSVLCKAKANGNYMNSILALQEAQKRGYDEALLLDHQGFVAEGSGENIFIVRDGVLYTPELTSVLEGITRDTIFKLAADMNLSVREKRITRDEVYIADEAFFTGTAAEVTPIREVDDRLIGDGKRGPITRELQELYAQQVRGRKSTHPAWLTFV
jgi:branched-chain amino acid aminotransferase